MCIYHLGSHLGTGRPGNVMMLRREPLQNPLAALRHLTLSVELMEGFQGGGISTRLEEGKSMSSLLKLILSRRLE